MAAELALPLEQLRAAADPAEVEPALAGYLAIADRFRWRARENGTWRTYAAAWNLVRRACRRLGLAAVPMTPQTARLVFAMLADSGYSMSYIDEACIVVRHVHRWAKVPAPFDDPDVRDTLRGIRKVLGSAPRRRKIALTADEMMAALTGVDDLQEATVIVTAFAFALRRSEAVALDIEDVAIEPTGAALTIRHSKTDPYSAGTTLWVERGERCCPVAALEDWLATLGATSGPLFRHVGPSGYTTHRLSARTVARWTQRGAARIGLEPETVGAHSLRAGCVTALLAAGVPAPAVAEHSRHASLDSLIPYWRPRGAQVVNVTAVLGL